MPRRYRYGEQILFYFFLIAYILLLAQSLLFKEASLFALLRGDRIFTRAINLIPFKMIVAYMHFNIWVALINVAGNMVLFIPLGLYLQIFKRDQKILGGVALVCAVSLCVEGIQYGLGIGSADIDDVILNTLGGLLGLWIYRMMYGLLKDESKTRTAVTILFALVVVGFGVCYLVLTCLLGYRIKIL